MDYMSVNEAAEKWGISARWVHKLLEDGRVDGVLRFGRAWMIPKDAEKPIDPRKTRRTKEADEEGRRDDEE